jgi:hypothetical protein
MNMTANPSLTVPEADIGAALARSGAVKAERKKPGAGVSWNVLPVATINSPEYLLKEVLWVAATVNIAGLCGLEETEPFVVLTVTETLFGAEIRTIPVTSSQSMLPPAILNLISDCGSISTRTFEVSVIMADERPPVATPEILKRAVPEAAGSPLTLTSPYAASSPTIFSGPNGSALRAKAEGIVACKLTASVRASIV